MFIIELPNPSEFSALLPLPLPHLRLVKIQSTVHQTEAHMHSVWVRASISPPLFCFVNKMDYNRIYYNGLHVKLRVFIGSDLYQLGHEIKYTFHCVLWWRVWKQWSTLWCYSICSPWTLVPGRLFLVCNGIRTEIEKKHLQVFVAIWHCQFSRFWSVDLSHWKV